MRKIELDSGPPDARPGRCPAADPRFDQGYEGVRRRQARLGLRLTPLERLRWLEERMRELRRMLGKARESTPAE